MVHWLIRTPSLEPTKIFSSMHFGIGTVFETNSIAFAFNLKVRCIQCSSNSRASVYTSCMEPFKSDTSLETTGIVPLSVAERIVPDALAWASIHGILMGDRTNENSGKIPGVGLVHAPICLLPSPFSDEQFKQAIELAPLFNELIDAVSLDHVFLQETLSRTRKTDNFTARLLDIHSMVIKEGTKQAVRLGLHRSDYMADLLSGDLLQIEINTISSSFGGLGTQVSQLHRYLLEFIQNHSDLCSKNVPENRAADGLAKAISLAFKEFGEPRAIVLMVVQPEERNMYDQYWLSTKITEQYGILVIRKTLAEVHTEGVFHPDGTFLIDGQKVAVVYYRAGYDPKDYPTENEWAARTSIERSNAIKSPNIGYHLAGTKKVQQELAKTSVLERFVQDADAVRKLRKSFAGLWGLDDEGESEIFNQAISKPEGFVLKPQREGGGNNLFGGDIKKKLLELKEGSTDDSFAAYILMQRIFPPVHITYMLRNGKLTAQGAVSELGIFATYVRNNEKVILNEQTGYLLRTKASDSDEGGVAAGFAFLDSVYLIEGSKK